MTLALFVAGWLACGVVGAALGNWPFRRDFRKNMPVFLWVLFICGGLAGLLAGVFVFLLVPRDC